MARQYPNLTKKELQDRLKQYKSQGAKVSGSVAELDARLSQFEQQSSSNAAGANVAREGEEGSVLERAPVLTKGHGVGSRPVSPVKDIAAPLKKGSALRSVIYQHEGYHSITIKCLVTLNACPVLHDDENDDEGEEDNSHQQLRTSLLPVLSLCEVIANHTAHMVRTGMLDSSFTVNLCKLQSGMLGDVKKIKTKFASSLGEPLVAELFHMFTDDVTLEPSAFVAPRAALSARTEADSEDPELQAVMAESLREYQEAQETAIDAQQAEISRYYEELTLRGDKAVADDSEGRGDVPPMDEVVKQIPKQGITFSALFRELNIHRHDRELLEGFQEALRPFVRVKSSKLFPKTEGETGDKVPSDDQVREILSQMGTRGLVFEDLMKYLKVGEMTFAEAMAFRESIVSRGIVVSNEGGRLVLPATETPMKNPLLGRPTLTPSTGGGSATPARKGDPDKLASRPVGTELITPAGPASRKSQGGWYGHDGGEEEEDGESSILSPVRLRTSHPRLGMELDRIRNGILAHFRNWEDKFPEPSHGVWMIDFSEKERSEIRNFIRSYLQAKGMVGKPDTTNTAVEELMQRADFPVAKGHHKAAIKSVVTECHTKKAMKGKAAAAKKAASGDEAATKGGNEDENESTDSDGDHGDVGGDVPNVEAGSPAVPRLKRKRSERAESTRASKKMRAQAEAAGEVTAQSGTDEAGKAPTDGDDAE